MVPDVQDWRQIVQNVIGDNDVTASLVKKQKNGLLIRIGSQSKEVLQKVLDRAAEIV